MIKVSKQLSKQGEYIRHTVFILEQGFNVEIDDLDSSSFHVVYYLKDNPVAACRFYLENDNVSYHLGRFAVLKEYRNKHIGKEMLKEVIEYIKQLGGKQIVLSSQLDVVGFYLKSGFEVVSDIYYEQHCPHKDMILKIR